jgi:hypothetical protein
MYSKCWSVWSKVRLAGCFLFHDFHFEPQLFSTKNRGQVKLPKLSGESQGWPTLIEIHQKLDA